MKVAGFLLCIVISGVTFLLSVIYPLLDALTISLIAGILLGNLIGKNEDFNAGISLSLKIFLPLGILLYGSQLVFNYDIASSFSAMGIVPMILLLLFTLALSKILKLPGNIGILLATGISICGASAIAIVSPVIKAKKNEVSIAVVSTMVVGIIAIITFPLIRGLLEFSSEAYAFLVGATVPMIGQVKVTAGSDMFPLALSIKLLRVSFLAFLIPIFLIAKKGSKRKFYVPWFVIGFIGLAVAFNTTPALDRIRELIAPVSTFSLATALAAIGLDVDLELMTIEGLKPLIALFLSWILVVFMVLAYITYV